MSEDIVVVVRRVIEADADFLFEAWTTPVHLVAWWGPKGVRCSEAEVDLRVGGAYRIVNELPDRKTVIIAGEFVSIDRPRRLVYTWRIGGEASQVTVDFEPRGEATEVVVTHARIPDEATRESHEGGWNGCLDGLVQFAIR